MIRSRVVVALSLVLASACVHAPREAARVLASAPAPAPAAPAAATDRDGDGFLDSVDKCADDPGVEPDGCPIPDTDGDAVLDPDDRCPTEPESRNGYMDEDGCPDAVPQQLAKFTGGIRGVAFGGGGPAARGAEQRASFESYARVRDNPFVRVADDPLATFAADVDTASYSNMRRFVRGGDLPPVDAVRIEEFINYFDYDYPQPQGDATFAVVGEVGPCPWNPKHRLVHVGVQARSLATGAVPPRNLVFLIDVSGSMAEANKLPLLVRALGKLVDGLRPQDRVAIAVYAGAAGVVLEPTGGEQREAIRAALERLTAGGSTAGGQGIELAYALAQRHSAKGAINRVILATDGDFNVGTTSTRALTKLIEQKRRTGIQLTVLGFGMGNLNDALMESLADHGDGNYAYIDSDPEAEKVLVREAAGTLATVARDVKLQVEFDRARVASYRQIGYDNRQLADRDFKDDRKDAGEVGAGHAVTALFEVEPAAPRPPGDRGDPLLTVKLRYKAPQGDRSTEQAVAVADPGERALAATSDDFRFSAAVAELGLLLREAPGRGEASYAQVLELARAARGADPHGDRGEFVSLVEKAQANLQAASARRAAQEEWLRAARQAAAAPASKAVRKARLLPAGSIPHLRSVGEMMREFPTIRVEVVGHTDDREGGSREEQIAISRARAEAVELFLVESEGVDHRRIEVHAAGADEPIDTNKTAQGRARNRRVDFTILTQ